MPKSKLSVLFITSDSFPTDRSLLSDLFNKEFVDNGNEIRWVMQPKDNNVCIKSTHWAQSKLFLTRSHSGNIILQIKGFLLSLIDKYKISNNEIKRNKPDIIQVRNGIFESLISIRLSNKYGIKFSFMLSSMHGFYDDKNILKDYSGFRYGYYIIFSYVKSKVYKRIIQRSDFFQPITEWMEKALSKNNVNMNKTFPLPLSSNDYFVNFNETDTGPDFDLVYLGSIRGSRDMDFLIRSFSLVSKSIPNCSLLIVGGEEIKGDGKKLEEIIKRSNVLDRVHVTGTIERQMVPNFLKRARIGLSPIPPTMKFKVSSPSKFVEYMSLGLPVVATNDIHDQRETLRKSGGGILTNYSEKEFSKAIIYLLKNKNKARKMGKLGKFWISKNRNYKELSKRLEEKYHEILS